MVNQRTYVLVYTEPYGSGKEPDVSSKLRKLAFFIKMLGVLGSSGGTLKVVHLVEEETRLRDGGDRRRHDNT